MLQDIFMEGTVFVIIMIVLGVLSLFIRGCFYLYINYLLEASNNMGKVKKGFLRKVRKDYDKELLIHERVENVEIFVEKEMTKLTFGGMSAAFVRYLNIQGIMLVAILCFLGMIQGMVEDWSTETMSVLFVAALMIFAILVTAENLLRVDDKLVSLEIRLIDYLENDLKCELLMGDRLQGLRGQEDMKQLLQLLEEKIRTMDFPEYEKSGKAGDEGAKQQATKDRISDEDLVMEVLHELLSEA